MMRRIPLLVHLSRSRMPFVGKSTLPNLQLVVRESFQLPSVQMKQFHASSIALENLEIKVPSMGDSISEGTIVEWVKSPGDNVQVDDVIAVLETDKVSVDVRSPQSGALKQQLANVDDVVLVGAALASISVGEQVPETVVKSLETVAASQTIKVPSMGDSISEGTIVEWLVNPGDQVEEDDVIAVIETDKVSVDVRAPESGSIDKILAEIDQVVEIGAPLAELTPGQVTKSKTPPVKEASTTAAAASSPPQVEIKKPATPTTPETLRNSTSDRETRREKMNRMRLRIAQRLKESQNIAASLTTFQDCDMGNLIEMRKKYKESFEKQHGVKLGFMSAFIKASSEALLQVPSVNAYIDDATNEIVYRNYVDTSVAVATPKGLVTPVLKDTHRMSFADIEKKLAELADRARRDEITIDEMMGGNFTISNGGVFGSLMGTPIINRPQSAILGMHATKTRPVVYNGEIVARPMMYLALTYDHRIVDGREAVTCLKSIADKIQDPERMLLNL